MTTLALVLMALAVSGPAPDADDGRATSHDGDGDGDVRQAHPLDLAAQLGTIFGLGVTGYSISNAVNAHDWTYGFDARSFRDKYLRLQGFRFDDNVHYLNSPGHPTAGALYYFLARENGFDRLPSFGVAALGSLFWETVPEYREVVSINDMIFTPAGGVALGEASYATVTYLEDKDRVRADDDVTGRVRLSTGPLLTFVEGGAGAAAGPAVSWPAWRLSFASDLVEIPGLLSPGRRSFSFVATDRAHLRAAAAFGQGGIAADDVEGMISIAGVGVNDVGVDDNGTPTGGAALLMLTSDFSHNELNGLGHLDVDRLARVSLVGADVELYGTYGGAHLSASLALTPDFATITPRALAADPALLSGVKTKSVLEDRGYYFALGGSAAAAAAAAWGPFVGDAAITARTYQSVDGLDQGQAHVVDELHGSERRFEARAGLAFRPSAWRVGLRVDGAHAWQGGTLGRYYGDGAVDAVTFALFTPL